MFWAPVVNEAFLHCNTLFFFYHIDFICLLHYSIHHLLFVSPHQFAGAERVSVNIMQRGNDVSIDELSEQQLLLHMNLKSL